MLDDRYDYDNSEYDDEEQSASDKKLRGLQIIIVILLVVLAGVSVLYYSISKQQKEDYELLRIDRDSIQSNLSGLIDEYNNLQYKNDTITASLEHANQVMEQLKRERRFNYAKLKEYEKEVGTLRAVMKNYIRQIDSLNTLNKKLVAENVSYKKEISSANLRASVAEEKATELNNRVQQGAVLRAREIAMSPLNKKGNIISRVKSAASLRVDFVIAANDFAQPGNKRIYVRILSPDGYLLSSESIPTFPYQGSTLGYSESRDVDYQNEDLPVSIFYKGNGFLPGKYKVELYTEGQLMASSEVSMK